MSLFFKRERAVLGMLKEYFRVVDEAMALWAEAMDTFLESGKTGEFVEMDKAIHRKESLADDLRREVEKELYSHALLPESRDDLLGLLEKFDKHPNLAEVITFMCVTQCIEVPPAYRPRLAQLVEANHQAYRLVRAMVDRLFEDPDSVGEAVGPVDAKESEGDRLERGLIIDIFADDLPGVQKILLRELVQRIGDISDSAENVARRLEIISLKKRI